MRNEAATTRTLTTLFALQWLISGLSAAITTPVALGPVFGLSGPEVAALVQRTLLVSGTATLVQSYIGHRMPIQEGPAGLWFGVFLVLAGAAPALGITVPELRADVQLGLIAAGLLMVLLGSLGLVRRLASRMTPLVTGSYLLLLALQVSGPFVRGMAGGETPELTTFLLSATTLAIIAGCSLYGQGALRSLAVLIGLLTGWLLFIITGAGGIPTFGEIPLVQLPQLFAWGSPSLNAGVILTSLVTGLLAFINLFGAMEAMSAVTRTEPAPADYDRGGLAMGINHMLSGIGGQGGIIVLTHSAALVSLMGPGSMGALRLAGAAIALLGFFPAVAAVFAAIPAPVGYAALFALFAQVAGIGLQRLGTVVREPRALTAAGIGLMAGVGAMMLPSSLISLLPPILRFIVGNGLMVGTLTVLGLELLLQIPARREGD